MVGGITNEITKVLRPFGYRIATKSLITLGSLFNECKDKTPTNEKSVEYTASHALIVIPRIRETVQNNSSCAHGDLQ